jgi:uncharacterized membrane protein
MKRLFAAIFVSLFFFFPKTALAKDYSIPKANFDVILKTDGSARVTETREYSFNGSYSWADEWIPKNNIKFQISSFQLLEGDKEYLAVTTDVNNPGHYYFVDQGDRVYIKWYYEAQNERKTFTLHYTITSAIVNHSDIAEFYWQLIGDQWPKGTGNVTATVHLPEAAPDNQIWGFGHGPLNGVVSISDNQTVTFSATNLPPKKFFEVRVLFPKLANVGSTGSSNLANILAEEKGFGDDTRRKSVVSLVVHGALSLVCILLALLAIFRVLHWYGIWEKVGKDTVLKPTNLADKLHEPPSDMHPALVEALMAWGLKVSGKSVAATVIELAER